MLVVCLGLSLLRMILIPPMIDIILFFKPAMWFDQDRALSICTPSALMQVFVSTAVPYTFIRTG